MGCCQIINLNFPHLKLIVKPCTRIQGVEGTQFQFWSNSIIKNEFTNSNKAIFRHFFIQIVAAQFPFHIYPTKPWSLFSCHQCSFYLFQGSCSFAHFHQLSCFLLSTQWFLSTLFTPLPAFVSEKKARIQNGRSLPRTLRYKQYLIFDVWIWNKAPDLQCVAGLLFLAHTVSSCSSFIWASSFEHETQYHCFDSRGK